MQEQWSAVEEYIVVHVAKHDDALNRTIESISEAEMPEISVTANEGKLLQLLAKTVNARNILEIGTLGGYSTIWLARALPKGGRLISLEFDPKHVRVAQKNVDAAGLSDVVDIRLGAAMETLPQLAGAGPFDLTFIDADKENNPGYFEWALKFSRPGSLIIVDNVVRDGKILEADSDSAAIQGVRSLFEMLANEPRVLATAIQTVGTKGYDGFAVALVL